MKIINSKSRASRGSTLMIAIIVTGLVGFVLAAYLGLLGAQNNTTMRSQAWNAAVPVVEAGIEDALSHLNAHGTTNLNCDNWNVAGDLYWMQRSVGDNYYIVTISNFVAGSSNNRPVIDSRGYVNAPVQVASSQEPLLADIVGSPSAAPAILGRGVRATTVPIPLFAKGMVAKGQIDLKGNNIETDSFDSTDPNYSTGGLYDPAKDKDHGDIATNSGLTNSISGGNATVMGHASTGPGGSMDIGPNGAVGDKAWVTNGNHGIKSGFTSDDMNVDFTDVPMPAGPWFTPGPSGAYLLTAGMNYKLDSLSMSSTKFVRVLPGPTTVLYIAGNLSMSGNSYIQIDPGASLKLYVGGASASLGGNGIMNSNANAASFYYYGLPGNTSLSMGGNAAFTGVIYAPNAALSLGGGGSTIYDFVGASISRTVNMNGHFHFHYDEALAKYGPIRGFIVTSWNELSPADVASLPAGVSAR